MEQGPYSRFLNLYYLLKFVSQLAGTIFLPGWAHFHSILTCVGIILRTSLQRIPQQRSYVILQQLNCLQRLPYTGIVDHCQTAHITALYHAPHPYTDSVLLVMVTMSKDYLGFGVGIGSARILSGGQQTIRAESVSSNPHRSVMLGIVNGVYSSNRSHLEYNRVAGLQQLLSYALISNKLISYWISILKLLPIWHCIYPI